MQLLETGAPGRIGDPVTVTHSNRTGLVSAAPGLEVPALVHQLALGEKIKLFTEIVQITQIVQVIILSKDL